MAFASTMFRSTSSNLFHTFIVSIIFDIPRVKKLNRWNYADLKELKSGLESFTINLYRYLKKVSIDT